MAKNTTTGVYYTSKAKCLLDETENEFLLNRQKIILAMLRKSQGAASRLQITKWTFLLAYETQSRGGSAFYQYVPYNYGPHSFTLYQEAQALMRDSLLVERNNDWVLTETGKSVTIKLVPDVEDDVTSIIKKYGKLDSTKLIDYVYDRYPRFTMNSAMIDKRAMARPVAVPAIYTMGYEGLLIDGFLDKLIFSGIARLVDVRNNPWSRRYGFAQSTLKYLCELLKIEYVHYPELGIPSEHREDLSSPAAYVRLFDMYERDILPNQTVRIKAVANEMKLKPSVLVCMEADPGSCHRTRLANAIKLLNDLPIINLGWPR